MSADYSFQNECNTVISVNTEGRINLPTGSGKSRIEFNHIFNKIDTCNGTHQIFVISAPRIVLCQQLIEDFIERFLEYYGLTELDSSLMFVSSGELPVVRHPNTGNVIKLKQCAVADTDRQLVARRIMDAKELSKHMFVFTTYASFESCVRGVNQAQNQTYPKSQVHLVADEAHFFAREFDWKNDQEIDPRTNKVRTIIPPFKTLTKHIDLFTTRFFFTATEKRKLVSTGSGLNNESVYGKEIYSKKPYELVPKNIICAPVRMHVGLPDDAHEGNMNEWVHDFILDSFYKHRKQIRKDCGDSAIAKTLGAKMLVAITGRRQLYQLLYAKDDNGLTFVDHCMADGIRVAWTMSNSKDKVELDDGTIIDAEIKPTIDKIPSKGIAKFLDELKSTCQTVSYANGKKQVDTLNKTNLIILHYDQLTEGIDVPSMTGLLLLRKMDEIKTLQSIGRVLRMHPDDRSKDYDEIDSTWIKPRSHIIVPDLKEMAEMIESMVTNFIEDYKSFDHIGHKDEKGGTGNNDEEDDGPVRPVSLVHPRDIKGTLQYDIDQLSKWQKKLELQVATGEITDLTL